jgi:hypothetical protein
MRTMRSLRCSLALLGVVQLAACQYLDRKDTMALGAGDSVRINSVTHVIDPWPAHAMNTRIAVDGERLQRAIERNRTNRITDPGCAAPDERGRYPTESGGTPCAESKPTPALPRRGGTPVPKDSAGGEPR